MTMLNYLLFLLLLSFCSSQSCNSFSYNQSCYNSSSGSGVCCPCKNNPFCIKSQDQCCGDCGGCQSYESCCTRIENGTSEGYCLYNKICCQGGTYQAYFCNSDQTCCGAGGCCSYEVSWTGVIIGSVIGFVILVIVALVCCRKNKQCADSQACNQCMGCCFMCCQCCCDLFFNNRRDGYVRKADNARPAYTD